MDLVAQLGRDMTPEGFATALAQAVDVSPVMGRTDLPLVSSDLRSRPESIVLATPETRMTDPRQVRVFGWYDNEWGFSARMLDVAARMSGKGTT